MKKTHGNEDFTSSKPYLLHPLVFFFFVFFYAGKWPYILWCNTNGGNKEQPQKTRTRTVKGREKTNMSWCITYEIYFICDCTCGVCVCVYNIYIYIYVYSACKH